MRAPANRIAAGLRTGLRLCAVALAMAACAAEPMGPIRVTPEVIRSTERYVYAYVVQPGDQLEVTVFRVPELTRSVTVRPDGYITLPLIKEIKVNGDTLPDLREKLQRAYAQRLIDPDITVNVLNPRQASVFVVGDVARPGPVPARDAPNVALALAAVGGPLRTGSLDSLAIIRLEEDGTLTGTIIPKPLRGETAFYQVMATTPVRPADMIVVPESGRSQFVRFIQDFISTPLTATGQILTPYIQLETVRLLRGVR